MASDLGTKQLPTGKTVVGSENPGKTTVTIQRIVRDTEVGIYVKTIYGYKCQVCGNVLETPVGPYAESAHIKPLGKPHNGPDTPENVLCLCPNHHVLFDSKSFAINDNLSLFGFKGTVYVDPKHKIDLDMLEYHRQQYFQ
jgi:putative restriction endonuclease